MNLKRYNEYLVAIVGTLAPLAILALIAWNLWPRHYGQPPPGLNVNRTPVAGAQQTKGVQHLALCAPNLYGDSDWQYIPLTSVLPKDADNGFVGSYPGGTMLEKMAAGNSVSLNNCRYTGGEPQSVTFNVLIRHGTSGEQHLLLQKPAVLGTLTLPGDKCAAGEGDAPCGILLWTLWDVDTNHDGTINYLDARHLYLSDPSGRNLRLISPADATTLDWSWDAKSKEIFIGIRRDSNKDGKFTDEDGADLLVTAVDPTSLAVPVLDPALRKTLEEALH